jgi:hypothetical protein
VFIDELADPDEIVGPRFAMDNGQGAGQNLERVTQGHADAPITYVQGEDATRCAQFTAPFRRQVCRRALDAANA